MEVHAHSHTERKKWTHYLWEFLMLFLAVFCGFLAENQREHMVENQREKQFMNSMIKDLQQDEINIQKSIVDETRTIQLADSIIQLFRGNDYSKQTGLIYYFARDFATPPFMFYMTDGTLMQLKNSGGLRLIRKQNVVDSLQAYYNLYQLLKAQQDHEIIEIDEYRTSMLRIFNVQVFDSIVKSYPEIIMPQGNPPLLNADPSLINEFLMRAHFCKRNKLANKVALLILKEKLTSLIALVKDEYNISGK
jgi:hypothetical protein